MNHFADALERGDLSYLRRYWAEKLPGLPQPEEADAAATMHYARTVTESVTLKARAYSHRWLEERAFPSGLPDQLKPEAERIYPRVVGAVGISVNTSNVYLRPAALEVRHAMENAVSEAYADGRTDAAFVGQRMEEARERSWKQLLG